MTHRQPDAATYSGAVDVDALRELMNRARRAFEQGGFELPTLQAFPAGSCGDVSEMVGQLLEDRGFGRWQYTPYQGLPSHAWLERDGWIIDITADQFKDRPEYAPTQPSVVVTRDRTWRNDHFSTPEGRRVAGMSWFSGNRFEAQAHRDFARLEQRTRD